MANQNMRIGSISVHIVFGEDDTPVDWDVTVEVNNRQTTGAVDLLAKVADAARAELFKQMEPEKSAADQLEELAKRVAERPATESPALDALFDPVTTWHTAKEIVIAHGGSIAATVRDLIDAQEVLRGSIKDRPKTTHAATCAESGDPESCGCHRSTSAFDRGDRR